MTIALHPARIEAQRLGYMVFHGLECRHCGGTERWAKSGKCVRGCKAADSKRHESVRPEALDDWDLVAKVHGVRYEDIR